MASGQLVVSAMVFHSAAAKVVEVRVNKDNKKKKFHGTLLGVNEKSVEERYTH